VRGRGELTAGDRQPAHRGQQRALEPVADVVEPRRGRGERVDAVALEERVRVELGTQGAEIVSSVRRVGPDAERGPRRPCPPDRYQEQDGAQDQAAPRTATAR